MKASLLCMATLIDEAHKDRLGLPVVCLPAMVMGACQACSANTVDAKSITRSLRPPSQQVRLYTLA